MPLYVLAEEEVSEYKLIFDDTLAADDQGQRPFHHIIKGDGFQTLVVLDLINGDCLFRVSL